MAFTSYRLIACHQQQNEIANLRFPRGFRRNFHQTALKYNVLRATKKTGFSDFRLHITLRENTTQHKHNPKRTHTHCTTTYLHTQLQRRDARQQKKTKRTKSLHRKTAVRQQFLLATTTTPPSPHPATSMPKAHSHKQNHTKNNENEEAFALDDAFSTSEEEEETWYEQYQYYDAVIMTWFSENLFLTGMLAPIVLWGLYHYAAPLLMPLAYTFVLLYSLGSYLVEEMFHRWMASQCSDYHNYYHRTTSTSSSSSFPPSSSSSQPPLSQNEYYAYEPFRDQHEYYAYVHGHECSMLVLQTTFAYLAKFLIVLGHGAVLYRVYQYLKTKQDHDHTVMVYQKAFQNKKQKQK